MTVSESPSAPIEIHVVPEDENDSISIVETLSDASFISVETDGVAVIKIVLKNDLTVVPGYYSVFAKIENTRKRSFTAKVTVHITAAEK